MSLVSIGAGNTTISGSSVNKNARYIQLDLNSSSIIGFDSGTELLGAYNTIFGFRAVRVGKKLNSVNALGYRAGELSTGMRNTFIGDSAGRKNERGFDNVFLGHVAGEASLGSENVAIGNFAARTLKGAGNVMLGFEETLESEDDGSGEFSTDAYLTEACVNLGYASHIAGVENVVLGARNNVGVEAERNCLLGGRLVQAANKSDNVVIGSRIENSGSGCVLIRPMTRHTHDAQQQPSRHILSTSSSTVDVFRNARDDVLNILGHIFGKPTDTGYALDLDADVVKIGIPGGVCMTVSQDAGIQMGGGVLEISKAAVAEEYFVRSAETGVKTAIFRRRIPWMLADLEPPATMEGVRSASCSRTHERVTLTYDLTFSVAPSEGEQTREVRMRLPEGVVLFPEHLEVPAPARIFKRPGKTTYASPERRAAGTVTLMTSGYCAAASAHVAGNERMVVLRLQDGTAPFLAGTYDASGALTFDGKDAPE